MKSFTLKAGLATLSLLSSAALFGCGSKNSNIADVADNEAVTSVCGEFTAYEDGLGNTYCLDSTGTILFAVSADGTITYAEIPNVTSSASDEVSSDSQIGSSDSQTAGEGSLNSSSSAVSYLCGESKAPTSIIGTRYFYSDAQGTYYYESSDATCTKNYLTIAASSSSVAETSSQSVNTETSSAGTVATSSESGVSSETALSSSSETVALSSASVISNGSEPTLVFSGSSLAITNNNNCVDTSETVVKISCAGNYYLSGTSTNYEVFVAADTSDKVYLYLNNLTLTSPNDAAIYAQSADKLFLVLPEGTTNKLTDASGRSKTWTYIDENETKTDTTKGVVYSKKDLTIKGNGSLTVTVACTDTSKCGNGIHTTKDLKIKDAPTLSVTAKNNALKGKRSVEIEGGNITLTSTYGDGIKSDEDDATKLAEGKGRVQITGGTFTINAKDDGIQASNEILVADSVSTPTITVKTTSGKGLSADSLITVNAGKINVDAADDGVHSNTSIVFNGGETTISSKDDGVHADSALHMNNGTVYVKTAYEGMEAAYMYMDGGITSTYGTDDGWNAAGETGNNNAPGGMGGGMQSSSKGYIYINGGYHYVSASGNDIDVLDANGTATQKGGVLILEIPTSSSGGFGGMGGMGGGSWGGSSSGQCATNGAGGLIDTDNGYTITGGVLLGFGSQTEEYPSCSSISYTNANYYGSANAAFKPQGSGSMIVYGGSVTSVSTVDVSGMSSITFPNGLSYYYK